MAEGEERLAGGNLNDEVVRVGDAVRRSAGTWTPAVHHLLSHLARRGYPAPRPLGVDDRGRELVTFVHGDCVHPHHLDLIATDRSMHRVGRLIADFHTAQSGYRPPADARWRSDGRDPTGSTEVIAHNDLAPWNLIVGPNGWAFIDWDLAAPGRRLWDLAWALQSFVGLWPDSALTDDQVARRITAFCDGARVPPGDREQLMDVVVERTADHAAMLRARASSGNPTFARLVSDGHADVWERASHHVATNRARWID